MGCGKLGIMNRLGNLQMGCWVLLTIIAAFPLPLHAAPATASFVAAKSSGQPVSPKLASPAQPVGASAGKPTATPASQSPGVSAAAPRGQASAPPAPPVEMRLAPLKDIYSRREGIVMQFIFTAKAKTKLCLDKDILSQMQLSVYRSGEGKLPLQPLVIKDNSHLFMAHEGAVVIAGPKFNCASQFKAFPVRCGIDLESRRVQRRCHV
jgi:hypothetical protein